MRHIIDNIARALNGKPIERLKMGRPTKMTDDIIGKLEAAFMMWFTDEEACLYADIHVDTLYAYCKKNPEFSERKERLKKSLRAVVKSNLSRELIKWDKQVTQFFAETKMKEEFSRRTEHTWAEWKELVPTVINIIKPE